MHTFNQHYNSQNIHPVKTGTQGTNSIDKHTHYQGHRFVYKSLTSPKRRYIQQGVSLSRRHFSLQTNWHQTDNGCGKGMYTLHHYAGHEYKLLSLLFSNWLNTCVCYFIKSKYYDN